MLSTLANKWVLITGASSGFGAAAARAFGAQGCRLLLGARRVDRLEQVAAEARQAGSPEAHFQSLDVSRTASVEVFVHWARAFTDKLDVLINNAGGAHGLDTVATGKDEDWEAMMDSNVLGVLRVPQGVFVVLGRLSRGFVPSQAAVLT